MVFNDHRHESFYTWLASHQAMRITFRVLRSPNVTEARLVTAIIRAAPGIRVDALLASRAGV
jgi:hypothetical protein